MFQQDIINGPGTGTFSQHTLEILVMLLGAFLLGLWFGWVLWNKYKRSYDQLRTDYDGLQASVTNLNSELSTLKTRLGAVDKERADLATRLANTEAENAEYLERWGDLQATYDALSLENRQLKTELSLTPAAVATTEPEPTPVVVVEEPAPAPEPVAVVEPEPEVVAPAATPEPVLEIDNQNNYDTDPAYASEEYVDDANFRFIMEDPNDDMLVEAASRSLAAPVEYDHFADPSFEALIEAPKADKPTKAPRAKATPKALVVTQHDDLKVVEGIGPKIEELLFNAGITTYQELAATPVDRLKEILAEAGSRFTMHDPGTWSAQSLLAANGEWDNLKAYQGFLDSGKSPKK